MISDEIKKNLELTIKDFNRYQKQTYEDVKYASETILNLTRALSCQLQTEEKYEDK